MEVYSLIFVSSITAIIVCYLFFRKQINFPPGPIAFPIFGNLSQLGSLAHLELERMSKKYGPILGLRFGQDRVVCLHGTKLIKEAYNEPAFNGRQDRQSLKFLFGEPNGIINSSGDIWSEQRCFALRNLRNFGFGKNSMEELIMEEVNEFNSWLRRQNGNAVPLQMRFSLAVVNSLWRILTGERIDHDDKKIHDIMSGLQDTAATVLNFESVKTLVLFCYPTIAKLFPNWSGWNRLNAIKTPRDQLFRDIIEQHLLDSSEDGPRDFIDIYLKEVKKTSNTKSSFYRGKGEKCLESVMSDFFLAGTETTAVTLSWAMLYLLHYPKVQKKLQEELDKEIGMSGSATLSARKRLPYTEAVILETLRISSIIPLTIGHEATIDTKFHGYDIPKGTLIFGNSHSAHHDSDIWGDPEVFRPERFLSKDGTTLEKHEGLLIPFSVGRRVCVGETLAMDTLFLFVSNLLHNFEVTIPTGSENPPLEVKRQATLAPTSSTLVMKERKHNIKL